MAKGVLPGEPNPSKPPMKGGKPVKRPLPKGKPDMPLPTEPGPMEGYNKLKNAFKKPGMQPGEKEAIAKIMKNRGVSAKEARAIGKRRTSKGLTTAGVRGPGGNPNWAKSRSGRVGGNTGPFPGGDAPSGTKPDSGYPVPGSVSSPARKVPRGKGRPVKMTGSGGKVYK